MKNILKIIIIFALILLLIIFSLNYSKHKINSENPRDCNNYSESNCPKECVVCPPCEVCSSLSCQTEEFCKSNGFNRSWYEDIKKRLEKIK